MADTQQTHTSWSQLQRIFEALRQFHSGRGVIIGRSKAPCTPSHPSCFYNSLFTYRLNLRESLHAPAVYQPGEVSDVEEYRQHLQKHVHSPQLIIQDVIRCCRFDHIERFKAVFEFANEHKMWKGILSSCYEDENHVDPGLEAALNNALSEGALRITRYLIEQGGVPLIMIPGSSEPYVGCTPLHFAIMNGQREIVQQMNDMLDLRQRKHFLHQEATGQFFSSVEGISGHPLSLAIFCGKIELFFDLIRCGGELDSLDSSGNSPLHTLVYYGLNEPQKAVEFLALILESDVCLTWYRLTFYTEVSSIPNSDKLAMKEYLLRLVNHEGYSVLTLAAKFGVYPIVEFLLDCEGVYKHTLWKLGATSCCFYDMSEIDPLVVAMENAGKPSVLELLLYERSDDRIPVLAAEPLCSLMEAKWRLNRSLFLVWALFHLITMIFQVSLANAGLGLPDVSNVTSSTTVSSDRPSNAHKFGQSAFTTTGLLFINVMTVVYMILTGIDTFVGLRYLIQGRLLWPASGHYHTPWSIILRFDEFDTIMTLYCICNVIWAFFYAFDYADASIPHAFALILGWYYVLFFSRAFRATSYFTVMLGRILFTDLLRFGLIMLVLIMGFGVGIMALYGSEPPPEFQGLAMTTTTMLLLMVGLGDVDYVMGHKHELYARVLSLTYILLATVLLLNLLIGAMTDTYAGISTNRESLFLKMRVRCCLVLERRLLKLFATTRLKKTLVHDSSRWYLEVRKGLLGGPGG